MTLARTLHRAEVEGGTATKPPLIPPLSQNRFHRHVECSETSADKPYFLIIDSGLLHCFTASQFTMTVAVFQPSARRSVFATPGGVSIYFYNFIKHKMKHLILTLLITCAAHVSLYSQVYIEDYTGYSKGNHYFSSTGCSFFSPMAPSSEGSVNYYTNNIDDNNSPFQIDGYLPGGADQVETFRGGFAVRSLPDRFMYFVDYRAKDFPQYAKIKRRLTNGSKVTLEVDISYSTVENIFEGITALEYAKLRMSYDWGRMTFNAGLFRNCINLRYVEFNIDHGSINMDAFLNCPKLEVIYFKKTPPDPNNMLKIFNSNYDNTGHWYYPNLKAIVVPDNNQSLWGGRDWNREFTDKVCKAVAEGSCKIITASEFNRKRVKGITISQSKITIKN